MIGDLKKPRRNRIEHDHQCAFFSWLRLNEKRQATLKLFYAIPNGGQRDHATAISLYLEGVNAGVLDTHLPVARQGKAGLWIEFKSDRGTLSIKQREFRELVEAENHLVHVVREWTEAARITIAYLGLEFKDLAMPPPPPPPEHQDRPS
jgi:hypothetical protein